MPRAVKCPHCGRSVPYGPQSPYRPFCSERCKMADLGAWASERYRIGGNVDDAGDDDGTAPPLPKRSPRG